MNKVKEVAMKIYKRECLGSGSGKCKDTGGAGVVGNEVWEVSRGPDLQGGVIPGF